MSLDPVRLRQAFALALGEPPPTAAEAEQLAHLLSVPEEVLAHLMLKRDGFRRSSKIRAALDAAARRAAASRRAEASVAIEDAVRVAARDEALDRALAAVVALQSREAATLEGAEAAMRARILLSPAAAYDAHLRISLPGQD